jgi:hypothetical protein
MGDFTALKKTAAPIPATTWMNLDDTKTKRPNRRDNTADCISTRCLEQANPHRQKVTGGSALLFGRREVLEVGVDNGCGRSGTTFWIDFYY